MYNLNENLNEVNNQEDLFNELEEVKKLLKQKIENKSIEINQNKKSFGNNIFLNNLSHIFSLSNFERKILLLCAGIELDSEFSMLCAKIHGDDKRFYPTFGLALSVFDDASWDVLTPQSPLRYWKLVELNTDLSLSLSPLKISERILYYLMGTYCIDENLAMIMRPITSAVEVVPTQQKIVDKVVKLWSQDKKKVPFIHLKGNDIVEKKAIAKLFSQKLGLNLYSINTKLLPTDIVSLENLRRLLDRESVLSHTVYLLEGGEIINKEYQLGIEYLTTRLETSCIISGCENLELQDQWLVDIEVNKPSKTEQQEIWQTHISALPDVKVTKEEIEGLTEQFNLAVHQINEICLELDDFGKAIDFKVIWEHCRNYLRKDVEGLVKIIKPKAKLDDLVLPEQQKQLLKQILSQIKNRHTVYQSWGFSEKTSHGYGISALFAGPSGTGKTLAAEALANELKLDLYYIDLSTVVSKYIGETEKNLKKVFDIAQDSGAILLFDEADALFGKRGDVKDSHDRYANIEVSYLLQRMENYSGLSILTTNLKNNIDHAFMRRLRFIVEFSFPKVVERAEIWRKIFPQKMPREKLRLDKLAHLNISGGNIHSVALNAAFIAADDQKSLTMEHISKAARTEYFKLEKNIPENFIKE